MPQIPTSVPSLLHVLFERYGGYVLHKAYPYERSDDSKAVTLLREQTSALSNVGFLPVPSAPPSRLELDVCQSFLEVNERKDGFLYEYDWPALQLYHSWRDALKFYAGELDSGLSHLDWVRNRYRVPEYGSLLIVGLPVSYLGYEARFERNQPEDDSDLRRVLDEAGYPNRFLFSQPNPHESMICRDRKTWSSARSKLNEQEATVLGKLPNRDFGTIFVGRTNLGRLVSVVAGSTELATMGGLSLLCAGHPLIDQAVETFENGNSRCIDIVFQSERVTNPSETLSFPFSHPSDDVRTTILNTDPTGFLWGQRGEINFRQIQKAIGQQESESVADKSEPAFRWTSDGETITIDCRNVICVGKRHYFLSDKTWKVFQELRTLVSDHAQQWISQRDEVIKWLQDPGRSNPRAVANLSRLMVLVLGESGTGKQLIAEYVAEAWGGSQLTGNYRAENGNGEFSYPEYQRMEEDLRKAIKTWPASPDSLSLTLGSIPTISENLATNALFGSVAGAFTDGKGDVGLFSRAGSGTLFLDEYLAVEGHIQQLQLTALSSGTFISTGYHQPSTFACAIVAATNRAANQGELERLQVDGQIPRDLIQRFSRTFELPALRERPEEVLPAIIAVFAYHERNEHQGNEDEVDDAVRNTKLSITREALEAIITSSFQGNFRELARAADAIHRACREETKTISDDARHKSGKEKDQSGEQPTEHADHKVIRLKHLRAAGIIPHIPLLSGFTEDPETEPICIKLNWDVNLVDRPSSIRAEIATYPKLWKTWLGEFAEEYQAEVHAVVDSGDPEKFVDFCLEFAGACAEYGTEKRLNNKTELQKEPSLIHAEIDHYCGFPFADPTPLVKALQARNSRKKIKLQKPTSGEVKGPKLVSAHLKKAVLLLSGHLHDLEFIYQDPHAAKAEKPGSSAEK